jgi:hypothetical protein
MVTDMKSYTKRVSESTSIRKALDDLGAEPVGGSGFESETPEAEFSER